MGVRSVTGQGPNNALVSSSMARTPPENAPDPAPVVAAQEAKASPEPSKEQAHRTAKLAAPNPARQRAGTRLRVDAATERIVAQILNGNREVIKQIPPEELLKIMANVRRLNGLLFDQEA